MTQYAIQTHELTKRYGRRCAVDRLTLAVPSGAVAGFIGPNGAGKTTTMAMLLGLVTPSAGDGEVLGAPLTDRASYLPRVGASVEKPAFYGGLTGLENLRLLTLAGGNNPEQIPQVLEMVGLGTRGPDRFSRYSTGMKQRLSIAGALLGDPELLILDEPTNGLDPAAIHEVRQLVRRLARDGRTIFVSSHQLSELEQVCDWLVIIDNGRLRFHGRAEEFHGQDARITIVPLDVSAMPQLQRLALARGYKVERVDCSVLAVTGVGPEPRRAAAELNNAASTEGIVLAEVHIERMSLEERYLELLNGTADEEVA